MNYKYIIAMVSLVFVAFFIVFNITKEKNTNTITITSTDSIQAPPIQSNILINFIDQDLQIHYIKHDLTQKKDTLLATRPLTDYPTSLHTPKTNMLYFTSRVQGKTGQLFELNLLSNEQKQLTTQFNLVDFLKYDRLNAQIYMRVILPGHRNFSLAAYDINKKSVQIWNEQDQDLSVKDFDINPSTGEIIALTYSVSSEYKRISHNNKTQNFTEQPTYELQLVRFDSSTSPVYKINQEVLDISFRTHEVILTTIEKYVEENGKHIVLGLNPVTMALRTIIQDTEETDHIRYPQVDEENKGLYFLASLNDGQLIEDKSGKKIKKKAICYYDFETRLTTQVWSRNDGNISNFIMQYNN